MSELFSTRLLRTWLADATKSGANRLADACRMALDARAQVEEIDGYRRQERYDAWDEGYDLGWDEGIAYEKGNGSTKPPENPYPEPEEKPSTAAVTPECDAGTQESPVDITDKLGLTAADVRNTLAHIDEHGPTMLEQRTLAQEWLRLDARASVLEKAFKAAMRHVLSEPGFEDDWCSEAIDAGLEAIGSQIDTNGDESVARTKTKECEHGS